MLHVYLPWHLLCINYGYIGSGEREKAYGHTNRTHPCSTYQPRTHRWLRLLLQESSIKEVQQEGLCNDHRYTGRSILCEQLVDPSSSVVRPADWANTHFSKPPYSIPSKASHWGAHHSELSMPPSQSTTVWNFDTPCLAFATLSTLQSGKTLQGSGCFSQWS